MRTRCKRTIKVKTGTTRTITDRLWEYIKLLNEDERIQLISDLYYKDDKTYVYNNGLTITLKGMADYIYLSLDDKNLGKYNIVSRVINYNPIIVSIMFSNRIYDDVFWKNKKEESHGNDDICLICRNETSEEYPIKTYILDEQTSLEIAEVTGVEIPIEIPVKLCRHCMIDIVE